MGGCGCRNPNKHWGKNNFMTWRPGNLDFCLQVHIESTLTATFPFVTKSQMRKRKFEWHTEVWIINTTLLTLHNQNTLFEIWSWWRKWGDKKLYCKNGLGSINYSFSATTEQNRTSEVKGFDMRATALGISLYCGYFENFKETSIHINIFYAQIKDKVIKVNITIWYCQCFIFYSEAYNGKNILFIWIAFLPLISLSLIPLSLLLNISATRSFVSSAFLFLQRIPLSIISAIYSTSSAKEAVNEIFILWLKTAC